MNNNNLQPTNSIFQQLVVYYQNKNIKKAELRKVEPVKRASKKLIDILV